MKRETYVMRDGKLVPKRLARPLVRSNPAHHVISDGIEVKSMADGRMYTSKGKLRASYRAHGVEEVGNDPAARRAPKSFEPSMTEIVTDTKRALAELRSR